MQTRRVVMFMAVAASVCLPATAGADPISASDAVKAHTDRADAALERAVALFEAHRDGRAARALKANRSEIGKATAAAAKLLRDAVSPAERREAAKALRLVATARDDSVEVLVEALDEASGRAESKVAQAALSDTRGREKALGILAALAAELPEQAQQGLMKAVTALSTERASEASAEAKALASDAVSGRSKRTIAKSLNANLDGQAAAADKLAELIASEDSPEAAKRGLQRAYDAVTADHAAAAEAVAEFSEQMPAWARAFVEEIVTQAQTDATEMRENRPEPPTPEPPAGGRPPEQTPPGPPVDPGHP